jgi:hypothetical protein
MIFQMFQMLSPKCCVIYVKQDKGYVQKLKLKNEKLKSVALVRERSISTERIAACRRS